MWHKLANWILKHNRLLLVLLVLVTIALGWKGREASLSYEFAKAIPTDNPRYVDYLAFRNKYGDDGATIVIGIQTKSLFTPSIFNAFSSLHRDLKRTAGVQDVISVTSAVNLKRDEGTEKLKAVPLFDSTVASLDSAAQVFYSLPFYRDLLYNDETGAWIMALRMVPSEINSPKRTAIVNAIVERLEIFKEQTGIPTYISGLPYIRTIVSDRIQLEMKLFLVGSILVSALILLIFFRSFGAVALSLGVVLIGVVWSLGILVLTGYKITLLTALVPPLMVVIGVPNCIYFLNKFHTSFREKGSRREAIVQMIGKMGVITLFCNIAAAIGFAVFALTSSAILKEFGIVAGISIMSLFFISLVLIPGVLLHQKDPSASQMKYLDNALLQRSLIRLEIWALNHRKPIYITTLALLLLSAAGVMRLRSEGFIVDDLPKNDRIYTDLRFFESSFGGVMPLEIIVDSKKPYGITRNLSNLQKIDTLVQFLSSKPYMGRALSITEGLRFAKQGFFEGDSSFYLMPGDNDMIALKPYLAGRGKSGDSFSKLSGSFLDSTGSQARISVTMKDIGSERLPLVLDSVQKFSDELFDPAKYKVTLTGTSVTFLEGSRFIINGLKESVLWAFGLIALCMLFLFRSGRILVCSLIPNLVPLIITAGIMGWAGVSLKPSTVLVFSVALGIAIDITIRFLVSYRVEESQDSTAEKVVQTIRSTGLSIIYTSIVLIAGFVIFCFSSFGGTFALGWLTSLTLVIATIANLVLLPALLITMDRKKLK